MSRSLTYTVNKILPLEPHWHFVIKVKGRRFLGCLSVKISWRLGWVSRARWVLNKSDTLWLSKKSWIFSEKDFFIKILNPLFSWNSILQIINTASFPKIFKDTKSHFFFFWPHCTTCGGLSSLAMDWTCNPLWWTHAVHNTGLPGKSPPLDCQGSPQTPFLQNEKEIYYYSNMVSLLNANQIF